MKLIRIRGIDVVRGTAILAMITYHLSWNLSWFGVVDWQVSTGPGWRLFAGSIAGTFIFLSGVGLALAHQHGVRWYPFWQREAIIITAAAAVSGVTFMTFGETFVRFGILHAIAASSLVAVLFVRLPAYASFIAAAIFAFLPLWASNPVFDGQPLLWTGLGEPHFASVDYVPMAPWTALALLGVFITRSEFTSPILHRLQSLSFGSATGRFLVFLGRKSLIIYLVHQPILFGLIWAMSATGLVPDRTTQHFLENCSQTCSVSEGADTSCREVCACTLHALQSGGHWTPLIQDPQNQSLRDNLNARYSACLTDPEAFESVTSGR